MSLRGKLIISISVGLIAIYLGIFGWVQNYFKDRLIKEGLSEMVITGKFLRAAIQNRVLHVEEDVQNNAQILDNLSLTDAEILSILRQTVINNQGETYGMALSYLPEIKRQSQYFYMKDDSLHFKNLAAQKDYGYEHTFWFQTALEMQSAGWTTAYVDSGGGDDKMLTYFEPIHNKNKERIAILTGDLSLNWVHEILAEDFLTKFPYNKWIIQIDDQLLISMDSSENSIIFDKNLLQSSSAVSNIELDSSMSLHGVRWQDEDIYILSLPLDFNKWDLQIAFKKSDILHSYDQTMRIIQIFFAAGLLLLIIVTAWITNRNLKPILHLSTSISNIGNGRLNHKVPYTNKTDEIGTLARAFEKMQADLKQYIKDLKQSTREQARIQKELEVGHKIQNALLPAPADLQHISSFSVGSYMKPAKEVGGDIYDYFELPDGNICFVLGDVSGKGIPASLLMASVRSSIRALAFNGKSPSEIISYINNDLAAKNETFHFITLICAVTDFANRQLLYCNAGHERPFLLRENFAPEEIVTTPQMAVGILSDTVYTHQVLSLEHQPTFFLYSDGVTDALNKSEIPFGKNQLIQILSGKTQAEQIVQDCITALEQHTQQAEAFDDITILAIQFKM